MVIQHMFIMKVEVLHLILKSDKDIVTLRRKARIVEAEEQAVAMQRPVNTPLCHQTSGDCYAMRCFVCGLT
jgi:hypothetical protein